MITSTTHFILNVKKAVSSRQVWDYLIIRDCKVKTKHQSHPDNGENDETKPENLNLSFRELDLILDRAGLEVPHGLTLVIDVVPPSEPRHDSA